MTNIDVSSGNRISQMRYHSFELNVILKTLSWYFYGNGWKANKVSNFWVASSL